MTTEETLMFIIEQKDARLKLLEGPKRKDWFLELRATQGELEDALRTLQGLQKEVASLRQEKAVWDQQRSERPASLPPMAVFHLRLNEQQLEEV